MITLKNHAITSTIGTSINATKPTGASVGDLIIAHITSSAGRLWATPSGWTMPPGDTVTNSQAISFYRVLDGTEGSTITFSVTNGSATLRAHLVLFGGTHPTTPIESGSFATGSFSPQTLVSINVTNGTELYTFGTRIGAIAPMTPPTGFTTDYSDQNVQTFVVAHQDNPAAGATGNKQWSWSGTSTSSSMLLSLVPAPVAPPGAVTLVGSATPSRGGTGSATITYASTAGNLLILTTQHINSDISGITDSAGNTWTLAGDSGTAGATSQRIVGVYYCLNAAAITSVTVTTVSGTGVLQVLLDEYSHAGSFGSAAVASNAASTTPAAATVSNVTLGDLVYGALAYNEAVAGTRLDTLQLGYTATTSYDNGGASTTLVGGAWANTVSGSTGPSWTMSSAASTGEVTVTFKKAVAGSGGKGNLIVSGAKKPFTSDSVIKGGAKSTATISIIVGGVKKPLV